MTRKSEYDFLTWKSFPSSIKLKNNEGRRVWTTHSLFRDLSIEPRNIVIEVKAKQEDIDLQFGAQSHIHMSNFDGGEWRYGPDLLLGYGSFGWKTMIKELKIPSDATLLRANLAGGAGTPEKPGTTWFDDLKIYQDGVLIYENKFTGLWPLTSVIAPIATGLGVVRLGKKG